MQPTNQNTLEQMLDAQFRSVFSNSMERLHAARTKHHSIALQLEQVKQEREAKERRELRAG